MNDMTSHQPKEVAVQRFGKEGTELAVFEFEDELRDLLISSFRDSYLTHGSYTSDARTVSSQGSMSLVLAGAGAGAAVLSAKFSSTLFMATADPATLMKLGSGVGSTVMGAGGFAGHAPFIPVASSVPVVAPILALQALNTAVMMQEFKAIDHKLDLINQRLNYVIARMQSKDLGRLIAATFIVDDIYTQYDLEGQFSTDMLIRLANAERDLKGLSASDRQLVVLTDMDDIHDEQEVDKANYHAYSAMLTSIAELRVAYLRVCVDMQENPKSIGVSTKNLKAMIDNAVPFWQKLQDRSRKMKDKVDELKKELDQMNWAERHLPGRKGGSVEKKHEQLHTAYVKTMESERKLSSEFHSLIDAAKKTRTQLDTLSLASSRNGSSTLVYWRDEAGEHSFVTDEKLISTNNRPA